MLKSKEKKVESETQLRKSKVLTNKQSFLYVRQVGFYLHWEIMIINNALAIPHKFVDKKEIRTFPVRRSQRQINYRHWNQ